MFSQEIYIKLGTFLLTKIKLFTFKTVFKLSIKFSFIKKFYENKNVTPRFVAIISIQNCLHNTEDDDEEMRCLKQITPPDSEEGGSNVFTN